MKEEQDYICDNCYKEFEFHYWDWRRKVYWDWYFDIACSKECEDELIKNH